MKVVILAGGYGTRISEETGVKPKPMVEVGDRPILWHVMKIYSSYGFNDFIICLGYKGHLIKEYFASYSLRMSNVTFDLRNNKMEVHHKEVEPWTITLVDTGEQSMTGGRIKRVREYLDEDTFLLTYGDGVSDVNINDLLSFHRMHGSLATLTAVRPPGRFGAFSLKQDNNKISTFKEKPLGDGAWINGGFFVLEKKAIDYVEDDYIVWEREPMEKLANEGLLAAYRHNGFWQSMDTLRDRSVLEELWRKEKPPWKIW